MKLSISNIAWSAEDDALMYKTLSGLGFRGLEIAPTRIFPAEPYEKLRQAARWSEELKYTYGLSVPSMQSIWYGRSESIFGGRQQQEALIEYTKKAVDFAEAVGCRNLVFGCPKNRNIPEGASPEQAVSFFATVADYAYEHGCTIGLEANPPIYNTNYINDTAAALEIVKDINCPGLKLNLDVGTMIHNGENAAVLKDNVRFISHVHISEPFLKPIEQRRLHEEICEVLTAEGYQGFVSIEMGKSDSVDSVIKAMAYIKGIFS